jgi:Reverse transcriptase (RNA-dependent DNA polymerase)
VTGWSPIRPWLSLVRRAVKPYDQVDGEHCDEDTIAASVVNDTTIRIVFILMIMADWASHLMDVKGAFLHGELNPGEEIYMEIPEGFEV